MKWIERGQRPFDVLSMGEVMLRLSPPSHERISTSESFEKTVGGSELNVISGISMLELRTGILSKLPNHALGQFVKNRIRAAGVSDDYLVLDADAGSRLGVYYYEIGAYPRKSSVLYDRARSAFTTLTIDEIAADAYESTRAFHVSGITLALGGQIRTLALEAIRRFKAQGAIISFDVNYRATLWSEAEAHKAMQEVLPLVDILFVSEETSRRMMRRTGTVEQLLDGYADEYGCKLVALTQRSALSPTRHTWHSLILDARNGREIYDEPAYEDIEVVDRVGSGDAYLAGVLSGLLTNEDDVLMALKTGNALAALKNTIKGDMPDSSVQEVRQIIAAHDGENQGEMNR